MRCCWPSHLTDPTGTRLRAESCPGRVSVDRGVVAASTGRAANPRVERAGSLRRGSNTRWVIRLPAWAGASLMANPRSAAGPCSRTPWCPGLWCMGRRVPWAACLEPPAWGCAPGRGCVVRRVPGATHPGLRFLLRCLGCPASVGVLRNEIAWADRCREARGRTASGCVGSGRIRATTSRARLQTRGPLSRGVPSSEILASQLGAGGRSRVRG